jgi:hypothetical protein
VKLAIKALPNVLLRYEVKTIDHVTAGRKSNSLGVDGSAVVSRATFDRVEAVRQCHGDE